MIEQLIPEDIAQDDTDHLMNIRRLTDQPIETTGDTDFTQNEFRQIIDGLSPRKALGPEGIISENLILVFKSIHKNVSSIYIECLKKRKLPQKLVESQDNSSPQT
jgi:hypothetical protein